MSRTLATSIGFIGVLLWATLAVLTVGTSPVPPLLLNAMCFGIGGGVGLIWVTATRSWSVLATVPLRVYAFGTFGLFGYHFLYFSALRAAPAAEAGLIAYLWPLLIVLFSGLLPNERLRALHIVGALVAFFGAALIVANGAAFNPDAIVGYLLAFACAFTWSGYSIISRTFKAAPTASVAVFCIASAVLSGFAHFFFETPQWPIGLNGWVSLILLGLGPVGLAFYVWDVGVKNGNIQILGTASYAAPLLSTLILVAVGIADPNLHLAISAILIAGGAGLAAYASRQTR